MKKEKQLDANGYRKFGIVDKLAYAAGDFGCNMSFALKSTVQTFWLAYMFMETGLLSALLLVVQIWDAINDPMIGSLIDSDTRKYKLGKFKSYIFIGACGLLIAGALVFLPLPEAIRMSQKTVNVVIKAIVFIVGYVIWDACYTIANVPYGSMLSLVTEDAGERAQLSTWRSIGSMIGNLVPGIILPMLIWKDVKYDGSGKIPLLDGEYHVNPETELPYEIGDQVLNPLTGANVQELLGSRVFLAALIMGILGFVAFIFMIKKITVRVDENSVKTSEKTEKFNVIKAFGAFMKNRPAVGATVAAMGMFLGMQSAATANTIMFATHFGKASLSGIVQMVGFLPMFLFMPFIKKIVEKYGKKEASVIGTLVSLLGGVIMMIFPMMPKGASLIVYMIGLVIFGLGMGVYTCVSWALMADAIEYNEWKTGHREEGTVYSLHSFFRKLAQGVGPSVVLLIMGALGYVSELGTIGQSAETAANMTWLVAGLYLFSAVLQFVGLALIYNLDKKTLDKMNSELAERKNAQAAVGETVSE
jgi:GPH family glycoside/pentoside/hexuronide:cation symporter